MGAINGQTYLLPPADSVQPVRKGVPLVKIQPNITGLRTDEQLAEFLARHTADTVSGRCLSLAVFGVGGWGRERRRHSYAGWLVVCGAGGGQLTAKPRRHCSL